MRLYVCFWLGLATSYTIMITLSCMILPDTPLETEYQRSNAIKITSVFWQSCVTGLDSLIVFTFMKLSNKLEERVS